MISNDFAYVPYSINAAFLCTLWCSVLSNVRSATAAGMTLRSLNAPYYARCFRMEDKGNVCFIHAGS